jgi:C-terminal processing protease CtpA/Prc
VAVGDRIVAVNGVLVDGAAMDQKALGNLIRRAPRPVRLTCEPQSLREAHEGKYTRS